MNINYIQWILVHTYIRVDPFLNNIYKKTKEKISKVGIKNYDTTVSTDVTEVFVFFYLGFYADSFTF